MEAVNGVTDGDKGGPPPPSPLTGCYLLIVIGEPHCHDHKDIILQKVAKGLLSWDVNDCLVDLEKELAVITEQALEGEEARYGERLIQFASENLVTEILIHPVVSTLAQCVRNLLSSFTRHRHIIHAGYTFANNGSWILQDGTFSLMDFSEAFQELDVLRVIRAYENGISLDIHCSPEGEWTRLPKEAFTKGCKLRVNPNDVLTAGSTSITNFINYLEPFLVAAELENVLESSDVVGNIRFSRPTLYVFPGGQGDAALFGINGFNMLLDGGFSRKACFWDFVRHLDRLDAVLLTRLNNSNVNGISAVLRRKKQNAVYPQIGHFFCNIQERKAILSPDGDKDKDPLLINLLEEGQEIVSNLRYLNLTPQVCYRDSEPINLYHKVGHGTLDMYVLSPAKDSKEVREFLQKWNNNDQKLFANQRSNRDFVFPIQNLVSICALLVWQPANPEDTITRILFPGSSPQNRIFEGLDKIKSLEFIRHPVCSEKSLVPVSVVKTKQSVLDRIIPSEKKIPIDNKREKPKAPADNENEIKNGEINGVQPEKTAPVKKSDSTESERSISKTKKIIENGEKPKNKAKPEIKPKTRSESQQRKVKPIEKKPSPTTPKKTLEKVNGDAKPKPKASPSATPAKSAKDANNRKVLESKIKAPPKKEPAKPIVEKKEVKTERKPISRRPKDTKLAGSPAKKVNGVQKPDSISRRGKLDKEGTTDSSTVSTPSADQDSILKKDISKLSTDDLQNLKAQELADLKEEQEAVKEIEAVFRKGELQDDKSSDFRKIKDLSLDDKLESEEYLIIEKTEIVQEDLTNETKEDETQKLTRDSEESEKQRKLSAEVQKEDVKETIVETQIEEPEEAEKIITPATEAVKSKDEIVQASKEVSVTSPEEKIDVSTDKKTTDKENENEIKEIAQESQPDEKGSTNIESGATTTAPTLPEDERMPLDEIKEDNCDQIEEKHVKEDTKEKDIPVIQLPPKTFESITKLPSVVGIKLDKQSHIRDIVKTPDEVADLPVHEEVDIDNYGDYAHSLETKKGDIADKVKSPEEEKKKVDDPKSAPIPLDKDEKDGDNKDDVDKIPKSDKAEPIEEQIKPKEKVVEVESTPSEVIQKPDDQKEESNDTKLNDREDTTVTPEDLNKKELSKSPDEEKDTDEHELQMKIESSDTKSPSPVQHDLVADKAEKELQIPEAKKSEELKMDVISTEKEAKDPENLPTQKVETQEIISLKEKIENEDKKEVDVKDIKESSVEPIKKTDLPQDAEVEIKVAESDNVIHDVPKVFKADDHKDETEEATDHAGKADDYKVIEKDFENSSETIPQEELRGHDYEFDTEKSSAEDIKNAEEQTKIIRDDVGEIHRIDGKLQKLKDKAEDQRRKSISEIVRIDHKIEEPQHAESVIIVTDSNPDSPAVEDKNIDIDEKMDLGRKSPKEREEDVAKIVASVAEVLKSDAPLEEFEGKLPFTIPYKSYTTELRETHITTVDSPLVDEKKIVDEAVCPKSVTSSFLEEERKIAPIHEEPEVVESKISKMIKESNELLQATSKIISEFKPPTIAETDDKEDQEGITVHRMLVTASSEDGGEEIEICPPGTITFSKSSESSGRSSPDPQSQKLSQKSSVADTVSDATVISKAAPKDHQSAADAVSKKPEKDDSEDVTKDTKAVIDKADCDIDKLEKEDKFSEQIVEQSHSVIDRVLDEVKDIPSNMLDKMVHDEHAVENKIMGRESVVESTVAPDIPEKDEFHINEDKISEFGEERRISIDDFKEQSEEKLQKEEMTVTKDTVGKVELAIADVKSSIDDLGEKKEDVEAMAESKIDEVKSKEEQIEAVKEIVGDAKHDKLETVKADVKPNLMDEKQFMTDIESQMEIIKDEVKSAGRQADKEDIIDKVEPIKDNLKSKTDDSEHEKETFIDKVKHIEESLEKELADVVEWTEEKFVEAEGKVKSVVDEVRESVLERRQSIVDTLTDLTASFMGPVDKEIDESKSEMNKAEDAPEKQKESGTEDVKVTDDNLQKDVTSTVEFTKPAIADIKPKMDQLEGTVEKEKGNFVHDMKLLEEVAQKELASIVDDTKEKLEEVKPKIDEIKAAVGKEKDILVEEIKLVEEVAQKEVASIMESTKEQLAEVKPKIDEIRDVAEKAKESLAKHIEFVEETVKEKLEKIGPVVGEIKDAAEKQTVSLAENIKVTEEVAQKEVAHIMEATKEILHDVKPKIDEVHNAVGERKKSVVDELKTIDEVAEKKASSIVESTKDKIEEVKDALEERRKSIVEELKEIAVASMVESSKEKMEEIKPKIDEMIEMVCERKESLVESLESVAESIQDNATSAFEGTIEKIEEIKRGVKSDLDEVKEQLFEKEESVVDSVHQLEAIIADKVGEALENQEQDNVKSEIQESLKASEMKVEEKIKDAEDSVVEAEEKLITVTASAIDQCKKLTEKAKDDVIEVEEKVKKESSSDVEGLQTIRHEDDEGTQHSEERISTEEKDVEKRIEEAIEPISEKTKDINEKTSTITVEVKDIADKADNAKTLKVDEEKSKKDSTEDMKVIEDKLVEPKEEVKVKVQDGVKKVDTTTSAVMDQLPIALTDPIEDDTKPGADGVHGDDEKEHSYDLINGLESVEKMVVDVLTADREESKETLDVSVDKMAVSKLSSGKSTPETFVDKLEQEKIKKDEELLASETKGSSKSIADALEAAERLVVDVVTSDRIEGSTKVDVVKQDSIVEQIEEEVEEFIEAGVKEVKEITSEAKNAITSIFRRDSYKEEVLEKAAEDIERNYEIVDEMAKSVIFEKIDKTTDEEKAKDEHVLEQSATSLEEYYNTVRDMTKSVVFEKCEKPLDEIHREERLLEKSAHDIEKNFDIVSEMAQSMVFDKCEKSEHELSEKREGNAHKRDVGVTESTILEKTDEPEKENKDSLVEMKKLMEQVEESVKSFEHHKETKALEAVLADLEEKSTERETGVSGFVHKLEHDVEQLIEGGADEIKEVIGHAKDTITSVFRRSSIIDEEKKDSDKVTPDKIQEPKTSSTLSELKPETQQSSGKSTPEIKEPIQMKVDSKDSLLSDKSSPALSGKSSPLLSGKSSPDNKEAGDSLLSGKSSPLLSGEVKDMSGKSTPVPSVYSRAEEEDEKETFFEKMEEEIEEVLERDAEKVKGFIEGAKEAISSIFRRDSHQEEVLEKSAQDLEKNYELVSDMSKSMVFETCEKPHSDTEKESTKKSEISHADDVSTTVPEPIVKTDIQHDVKAASLMVESSTGKKLSVSDVEISIQEPVEDIIKKTIEIPKTEEEVKKELDSMDSGIGTESKKVEESHTIDKISSGHIVIDSGKPSDKKEESIAGPSTTTKDTSLAPSRSSTEDLHLSGKSTPDIAEVEKIKQAQETLTFEKHIPGSSTPPTVPVSPIVKDTTPPEDAKVISTVKTSMVSSLKDSELRSITPGSDDYEIGVSTHSDISSGQFSRAPNLLESERIDSDEDDDVPGSPMSVTSQVAHSRSSSRYDFEDDRIGTKLDPMNTSFYGALPDEGADLDFEKALQEHRETRGEDLVTPAGEETSSSYLYEITKAKYSSSNTLDEDNANFQSGHSQMDQLNKNGHSNVMTDSFMGDLPSTTGAKKDLFDTWGKPLGLPSPAPPSDNRGTPKKERKLPSNVSVKNKMNDDRKRAESPSKYKNKKYNPVYVDLTYVPHHGNAYYSYVDFFKRVRARYYVFSGIEPSREVYNALLEAKQTWEDKELEVTIIPTYDTDILGYWVAENEELLTKYKIDLSPSASRCTINLQDHETSCSAYRLEF